MSELIVIPTVEQINIEHQLANSKANEAVQHATNCGLMLLQVKASKAHGEWLPWLNTAVESGELRVGLRQSRKYMQLAANMHREAHLLEAPSINAALELLSDKEPDEQQGTLIDVEAERQARRLAEQQVEAERQARLSAERRSEDWRTQSMKDRDEKRAAEEKILTLESQPAPEPTIKEVIPDDYEIAKQQAATLQTQTAELKRQIDELHSQQSKIVNDQVKAKLQERQNELNKLEREKELLESVIARHQSNLASLSSQERMIEAHRGVIEKQRLELISLAAFLSDLDVIVDKEVNDSWLRLSGMLRDGSNAILNYLGMDTESKSLLSDSSES